MDGDFMSGTWHHDGVGFSVWDACCCVSNRVGEDHMRKKLGNVKIRKKSIETGRQRMERFKVV